MTVLTIDQQSKFVYPEAACKRTCEAYDWRSLWRNALLWYSNFKSVRGWLKLLVHQWGWGLVIRKGGVNKPLFARCRPLILSSLTKRRNFNLPRWSVTCFRLAPTQSLTALHTWTLNPNPFAPENYVKDLSCIKPIEKTHNLPPPIILNFQQSSRISRRACCSQDHKYTHPSAQSPHL